jgi:hypothetical protein
MNILVHISENLETIFGLKILNSLMWIQIRAPESCLSWIRDRKIRIRDKHPGSATLLSARLNLGRPPGGTLHTELLYSDAVNTVDPDLPQEEKVDKEGAGDHGCGPEQKH